jgi:hypothetical protein
MSQEEDDIDARLAGFAERTAGLGPRAGFSSRVMLRVAEEPVASLVALKLPARRFLPVGMLAAALALVWAFSAHSAVNEALAVSYDETELTW